MREVSVRADGRLLALDPENARMSFASAGALAELSAFWELLATEEQVFVITLTLGLAPAGRDEDEPPGKRNGAVPHEGGGPTALAACVEALASTPHVTLAAIEGDCADEELEIALACDLRVPAADIRLGFPGVSAGVVPGEQTVRRLTSMIGRSRAADLLFTGRMIDARMAADWGLVEASALAEPVSQRARALAEIIAGGAPLAMRYAKEAVDRGYRMRLEDGLGLEGDLYAILQTTGDRSEGIRAFHERRGPRFTGA